MARDSAKEKKKQRFYADAQPLANTYWWIRASRFGSPRRKHYRRAAKEKARLAGLGWDQELIRLYGLYLRNPMREKRLQRVEEWFERPEQLRLF